jgi:hypothetical protein
MQGVAVVDRTECPSFNRVGAWGICLAMALLATAHGQTASPTTPTAGAGLSAENAPADGESLDKLLDMADKDVGQLSQVRVSGATGSPSLDMPV